ncbi:MAG: four helix bundle protein [Kiritimatiellae bacterium]|nr:four helix bundle protein [Kiritimatiellia bacterium]
MEMGTYRRLEDLRVYQKLCQLHIEVSAISHRWPPEERFELGGQVRRSSNSAPAQLAEKYDDRHVRNKIEGVNRSRGEAAETLHHLYMARLKRYETEETYDAYRVRYQECIRMLNGMERTLEQHLPVSDRRWPNSSVREDNSAYVFSPPGYPETSDPKTET